jgi:hypothetical protein
MVLNKCEVLIVAELNEIVLGNFDVFLNDFYGFLVEFVILVKREKG